MEPGVSDICPFRAMCWMGLKLPKLNIHDVLLLNHHNFENALVIIVKISLRRNWVNKFVSNKTQIHDLTIIRKKVWPEVARGWIRTLYVIRGWVCWVIFMFVSDLILVNWKAVRFRIRKLVDLWLRLTQILNSANNITQILSPSDPSPTIRNKLRFQKL